MSRQTTILRCASMLARHFATAAREASTAGTAKLHGYAYARPQPSLLWSLEAMYPVQLTQPLPPSERFSAVFIDAAGTLLKPSENSAAVYLRYASRYMSNPPSQQEVLERFRRAYNKPWGASPIRYVGDARPFWRYIVRESTGCESEEMFEEVYQYFARPEAWHLAPGAPSALRRLKAAGVKLAVVSNFDTRLRPLLDGLGLAGVFDAVIVSAEVGCEKPNRCIFDAALDALNVGSCDAVHVGDDRRNDVWGARDAGVHAWLWGADVRSFDELAYRVLYKPKLDWDWDPEGEEAQAVMEYHLRKQRGGSSSSSSSGSSSGHSPDAPCTACELPQRKQQ